MLNKFNEKNGPYEKPNVLAALPIAKPTPYLKY